MFSSKLEDGVTADCPIVKFKLYEDVSLTTKIPSVSNYILNFNAKTLTIPVWVPMKKTIYLKGVT